MDVQDYFEFIDETSIRIKGHRIYIDEVLEERLQGKEPEEILCCFPRLPLEKIYATILYYLTNKSEVEVYLERERLMDEEAGKLIEAYGKTPTLINWAERLEAARQKLIAEGKYPMMPQPVSEDPAA